MDSRYNVFLPCMDAAAMAHFLECVCFVSAVSRAPLKRGNLAIWNPKRKSGDCECQREPTTTTTTTVPDDDGPVLGHAIDYTSFPATYHLYIPHIYLFCEKKCFISSKIDKIQEFAYGRTTTHTTTIHYVGAHDSET